MESGEMNGDVRKVVAISGGSRGLGQAIAADFLARGHTVATFSRSRTPFIEEQQRSDPRGARFLWDVVDGADPERVKRFVLEVARRYGRIDVVVNNAAAAGESAFTLARPDDFRALIALNLEGALYFIQAAARVMLAQGSGAIINISSVTALRGHRGLSIYSATKAALDGLTRSLARELGPGGIRVNSVAPGYFESDMVRTLTREQRDRIVARTPLGRLGTVDDVVAAVAFLAAPESYFITGQTLIVDGGFTC
jgi:3-oxoacyl-[acyl-carrier protein] reductase